MKNKDTKPREYTLWANLSFPFFFPHICVKQTVPMMVLLVESAKSENLTA